MATTTTVQWMLAKAAELEMQAAALRTAATLLADDVHAGKRARVAQVVGQAIAVRRAQTNGHGDGDGAHAAPPAPTKKTRRRYNSPAERAIRRAQIFDIIRAYGKPMPIAALREAAQAQGLGGLTGMFGYVRAGFLKQLGRKGKTRYSLTQRAEE